MVTGAQPYLGDQTRSPIVAASIAAIAFAFLAIGVIAAYLPKSVPLAWPETFLVISAILTVVAVVLLSRRQSFAWPLFFEVVRWVCILPLIFAATAIFIFLADGTSGVTLGIMIAVLLLAAINIPLVIGFSVARHERVQDSPNAA